MGCTLQDMSCLSTIVRREGQGKIPQKTMEAHAASDKGLNADENPCLTWCNPNLPMKKKYNLSTKETRDRQYWVLL